MRHKVFKVKNYSVKSGGKFAAKFVKTLFFYFFEMLTLRFPVSYPDTVIFFKEVYYTAFMLISPLRTIWILVQKLGSCGFWGFCVRLSFRFDELNKNYNLTIVSYCPLMLFMTNFDIQTQALCNPFSSCFNAIYSFIHSTTEKATEKLRNNNENRKDLFIVYKKKVIKCVKYY